MKYVFSFLVLSLSALLYSQEVWHDTIRNVQYTPEGKDIVCFNGKNKFTRALYGTHTKYRIETSDYPEFGIFAPNMGGNIQFGLIRDDKSMWIAEADSIKSIYRAGSRIYKINDPFLGKGTITMTLLALADTEGLILKIESKDIPNNTTLFCLFGGATNKGFHRNGDLGADKPDCFALEPENCINNHFTLHKNQFALEYGKGSKSVRNAYGVFPNKTKLQLASPVDLTNPISVLEHTIAEKKAILSARIPIAPHAIQYMCIANKKVDEMELVQEFLKAENKRKLLANTVKIETPDVYLNPLGEVLSVAADGIWDNSWLHGAVGWRMPLTGWRAAYTGDCIGWHDRSRIHFRGYATSQIKDIEPTIPHPAQDTSRNFARAAKIWGTPMYSKGYICRYPNTTSKMHHYDMNQLYIDELLWHFNWTGDKAFLEEMWPVIERSIAWEKRNFDPNNDGLYDAYASIWASDALYYNSGSVTHASAINYRANNMAAIIAELIGKDPSPYREEAKKIYRAINKTLWMKEKGVWAEFKDYMGNQLLHPHPAVWTIYHAIDSDIETPFQAYQATRYIDTEIPHIPVAAKGIPKNKYQTISTSHWKPYLWSINNVAFAEVAHTSLAYWQAGRYEKAYQLFKSILLDGMYLGDSPGNIGQISFYDAARGECYRDFGDPIGIYSRALVQGLFGIQPDMLHHRLVIRPGFPGDWDSASISTSDIDFSFLRDGLLDSYVIKSHFERDTLVELLIKAPYESIDYLTVNEKKHSWVLVDNIGYPLVKIQCKKTDNLEVNIKWKGQKPTDSSYDRHNSIDDSWELNAGNKILAINDPQNVLKHTVINGTKLKGTISGVPGHRTLFILQAQGEMKWWEAVEVEVEIQKEEQVEIEMEKGPYEMVDIKPFFNARVTEIFEQEYLAPRSPYTTLQLPTQGIGEWCHPTHTAHINDSGLRASLQDDILHTSFGIPFQSVSDTGQNNIMFTSLWDNYPDSLLIPLQGKASSAYLMMAGSTNHMQYGIVNGMITVYYTDGTSETLNLINPETWLPIEQDLYLDNFAFSMNTPSIYRFSLKTGHISNELGGEMHIPADEVYGRAIDGGAGIFLELPLKEQKQLHSLTLKTIANEVVIGLMGVTLLK